MNHSGKTSIWLAGAGRRSATQATVDLPDRVDVVIVGAGLAGLCTAMACHHDGATVAVIDAGPIAGRTTGHSTAKLTALHGLTYDRLTREKGEETAAAYALANLAALDRLRQWIRTMRIDCDLVEATAYTCAATSGGVSAVEAEVVAASRAGLPVEYVDRTELTLPVAGAIALARQGHFNPVAFAFGLAERLRSGGAHVLEHSLVTDIEETSSGCVVRGPGLEIACDAAVITTHLPIVDPGFLAGRVRPERSYVVAGPVAAGLPPTGMYLAHDAGWSMRPGSSAHGPTLLVGGEGHSMTDHVDGDSHYAELRTFATDQLGVDVRYQWSAFDYATTDGLPFIGRLAPHSHRRYVATGFGKWGMTNSMVAGTLISDAIAGRDNPHRSIFDATRILPTITRDLVRNTAEVAARFIGDRLKARPQPDHTPGPGEGILVRKGTKTLAVARDRSGELHTVNAACTHLGCIVAFNHAEQTWDCPCHGSRFTIAGTVLDGPAKSPLQPQDLWSAT